MKTLRYSIEIARPVDVVFNAMIDESAYPHWAKAWGEGMQFDGEWKQGANLAFFDKSQGGTKVLVEELVPHECIKMKHIAMVNQDLDEQPLSDDAMRKWIGTREDYYFSAQGNNACTLEVVIQTDEMFEDMMNAWNQALQYLKDICESRD